MPARRWLARFNKRVTNRISEPLAPWLPWFGVVVHTGRRSGRRYRTPINVFPRGTTFTFALTYGPKTEWVQNVLASGGCDVEIHRRTIRLVQPRVYRDPERRGVPPFVRVALSVLGVADFLELRAADATGRLAEEPRHVGAKA